MTDENRPKITSLADLMPKLDPEAVAGLRNNMLALGAAAAQAEQALKQAAPAIMASIAKALPPLPDFLAERKP